MVDMRRVCTLGAAAGGELFWDEWRGNAVLFQLPSLTVDLRLRSMGVKGTSPIPAGARDRFPS
jgi:hypothetical protein